MKRKPLESVMEKAFVKHIRSLGLDSFKLRCLGRDGWPDQSVFVDGRMFGLEVKRTKNSVVQPSQIVMAELLESLGVKVVRPHDLDVAIAEFEKWQRVIKSK